MAINVKDKLVTVESLGISYSTEKGARQEADQALSTRIDNIVAPDGDPSLTEVSDARMSGSTTHNTLKARLDADQAAVGTEIAKLKADLSNITGNVAYTTWEDGYIRCNDATVDITDIRTGQYKHQIIDCSGGDVFTISGQSYGTAARLWCFISTDGTNLLAETANATVNDKIITAPSNATKLIINWSYVSYGTPDNIVTIYSGKLIKNTVSENTEQIDVMKTYYEYGNLFDHSKAHDGYAINISGTEEAHSGACSSDYINLKAGTYCYETAPSIYGANTKYVPTYTQANAFVSNVEGALDGNIVTFTLSADSRIKLKLASATYQQAMLVNGNVYPETYIPYFDGVLLSDNVKVKAKNIIPAIVGDNLLYGKEIVFDGDSICHGTSVGWSSPYYGWGYAGRIGTANDMVWHNVAQSGATITHGLKFSNDTDRHWISSYIDTIYANYPDADYIILEGGTNDADLLNTNAEKTGEVSQTAFANFDYDTYAGALDYLFYNALNKFPNAKIGFIVAQKMGIVSRYDSQFYRRRFFDMAIETCQKWSIPYIDLWNMSGLNPKVPAQYTEGSQTNLYTDGQHLTDLGYDKIAPIIEAWMKTL